jgi:acyl-CoA reductase-like NAD-dependent aldehyde dehydrogenase
VVDSVADELVQRVAEGVRALTVGSPEHDCDITPVISETSSNFIESLVKDARDKGEFFSPWVLLGGLLFQQPLEHKYECKPKLGCVSYPYQTTTTLCALRVSPTTLNGGPPGWC